MSGEPAHGWSARGLATLAAVFDTLVPSAPADAERRARLAAETLDAAADHGELRLLKLAVRSLEWPAANLALAGRRGRFSRLDRSAREAVLRSWSTHPIGRVRTAYQALRRLGLFLAFADPGDDPATPANPLWERIGYRPAPAAPVAEASIRPLALAPGQAPLMLEADAVVVGSGAGGGVVAARLAAAGVSVLVVEAGPYRSEAGMPAGEAEAFRDLYLDRGTTSSADLGITILAGAGLGGGTTINWTTSLAPPDWLRDEWASVHGLRGFDGPETAADIARLRAELDLQPPSVIPPKDRLILDGAAALGWEAAPTERNAGPCTECGSCGFGCRRGSKRSGTRTHLAAAQADGAEILADATVQRIEHEGGSVSGVSGRIGGPGGRRFSVRARQVVVAAGALRTPLLLERSGVDHPQLGRNLRLHPVVAVAARLEHPVEAWLGPSQATRSLEFSRPGPSSDDGIGPPHGGFVIESAPPHPGLTASALPWESGAVELALAVEMRHLAPLIAIIRDRGSGRVAWSRGGHPRISYRVGGPDGATARRALVELARLARAGGAVAVTGIATPALRWDSSESDAAFEVLLRRLARVSTAPNRVSFFSAHQMGSARAGADPAAAPCDPWGRVRDGTRGGVIRGLYVGDASLFPSASGVNPMMTVMALAERSARACLADR